jgi:hypothetical protein
MEARGGSFAPDGRGQNLSAAGRNRRYPRSHHVAWITPIGDDPADDVKIVRWAREFWEGLKPFVDRGRFRANTGKSQWWIRTRAEMPHLGLRGKHRSKMLVMNAMTPEEARAYFKRWELVRGVEAAELRRATMETKFQQLAALMASRHLFGPEPDREAQVHEVRERWTRLRRALGG